MVGRLVNVTHELDLSHNSSGVMRLVLWRFPHSLLSPEFAHCYCGTAVLDSPLALLSHAAAHLWTTFGAVTAGPTKCFAVPDEDNVQRNGGSRGTSHPPIASRHVLLPDSGAHVPCPWEIYRHVSGTYHFLLVWSPWYCFADLGNGQIPPMGIGVWRIDDRIGCSVIKLLDSE